MPFCESKCGYCAFASTTSRAQMADYFAALAADVAGELADYGRARGRFCLSSVYFGGGTPSAVPASFYAPIFEIFSPFLAADAEISAEANPSSLSREWLAQLRALGLNRLSLGVQSFSTRKLAELGRAHTAQQALAAIDLARAGCENLSIDFIYATPWDEPETELRELAALGLGHFSAYTLLIEPGTPFARRGVREAPAEATVELYRALCEILPPYEASNFAAPGRECRHNLRYWDGSEYLAAGLSAVSGLAGDFIAPVPADRAAAAPWLRRSASKNLCEYIRHPRAREIERLTNDEWRLEKLFLGLRSCCGASLEAAAPERLEVAKNEGLVRVKNGRIFAADYLLADEIALFLSV